MNTKQSNTAYTLITVMFSTAMLMALSLFVSIS